MDQEIKLTQKQSNSIEALLVHSYMPITKDSALSGQLFNHVSLLNKDGSPLRARRNGSTKTWKTRPNEFKIPAKYGLKQCFYITQDNAHEWRIVY